MEKNKFIEATREYIEKVTPLIEINKKICLSNIRFTSYQVMQLQGWFIENVEQKDGIITHPVKSRKFNKSKQYKE